MLSPKAARRARGRIWAQAILAVGDAWMVVDVEALGLHMGADIIEVAAVTLDGEVLADCLVRPQKPITPQIADLTGITNAMVADAPGFAAAYEKRLRAPLASCKILAYNVAVDVRFLRDNIARHCGEEWHPIGQDCLMHAYAEYRGARNPHDHHRAGKIRPLKLSEAAAQMGLAHENAHRALNDCLVGVELLRAMAQE
jgi:DNA polymerase-3 subunit epsilon